MSITAASGVRIATVIGALVLSGGPALGLGMALNGHGEEPGQEWPISLGQWVKFGWLGVGEFELPGSPWTFSHDAPTLVRVTDVSCYGDRFLVSDNGAELGLTTAPGSTNCGGPEGADEGYADPEMSSGCWLLAPGAHAIGITIAENPHHLGGAFVRADLLTTDLVVTLDCPVHALLHGLGIPSPP